MCHLMCTEIKFLKSIDLGIIIPTLITEYNHIYTKFHHNSIVKLNHS